MSSGARPAKRARTGRRAASAIVGVVVLSVGSACVLPPDEVAEFVSGQDEASGTTAVAPDLPEGDSEDGFEEDGFETESGEPEPPSCLGDCPCEGSYCEQFCFGDFGPPFDVCELDCSADAVCMQTCVEANCASTCDNASGCYLDCTMGSSCDQSCVDTGVCQTLCSFDCSSFCDNTDCTMSCPGGGCTMHCRDSESCELLDCPFGCTMICENVGSCVLDCFDPDTCLVIDMP